MKFASFRDDVGRQCLFQTLPEMTIPTPDGVRPWAVHQFRAAMAVNADHPLLLVDVRGELMVFNAIWPVQRRIDGLTGEIGRPVFLVEVVFKTAVVIGTDPVAVVALQALLVAGRCQEGVGRWRAVVEIEVAGRASDAMAHKRIGIAAGVRMTAQTAPAQQVVRQLQGRFRGFVHGNPGEMSQGFLGAKGLSHQIDLACQGKMNGFGGPCGLIGMTTAAGLRHQCRMGGADDEVEMGGLLIVAGVIPSMTA